jgi:hypothetical protein
MYITFLQPPSQNVLIQPTSAHILTYSDLTEPLTLYRAQPFCLKCGFRYLLAWKTRALVHALSGSALCLLVIQGINRSGPDGLLDGVQSRLFEMAAGYCHHPASSPNTKSPHGWPKDENLCCGYQLPRAFDRYSRHSIHKSSDHCSISNSKFISPVPTYDSAELVDLGATSTRKRRLSSHGSRL